MPILLTNAQGEKSDSQLTHYEKAALIYPKTING